MLMSKRTWIFLGIVAVLAVLAVIGLPLLRRNIVNSTINTAAQTEVITATLGNAAQQVQASGSLTATQSSSLSLRANGRVAAVFVKPGDHVSAGETLLRLETDSLERSLANAEASLTIQEQTIEKMPLKTRLDDAQAVIDTAQEKLDTLKNDLHLTGPDAVSKSDLTKSQQNNLDNAEKKLSDAKDAYADIANTPDWQIVQAQLSQAKTNLATAKANLAEATLLAPFAGVIYQVKASVGEQTNGVVIELLDPNSLEARLAVDEIDVAGVRIGQSVTLSTDAYPDVLLSGQVLYIAPAATTATSANDSVTYEVAVELLGESPENVQLAAGMTIDGEILVSEQEDVVLVPNQAITYSTDRASYVVYKSVTTGTTTSVTEAPVLLGIRSGEQTVILSGVSANDKLVINGSSLLAAGNSLRAGPLR
jgi:HlyD family secretion protein